MVLVSVVSVQVFLSIFSCVLGMIQATFISHNGRSLQGFLRADYSLGMVDLSKFFLPASCNNSYSCLVRKFMSVAPTAVELSWKVPGGSHS